MGPLIASLAAYAIKILAPVAKRAGSLIVDSLARVAAHGELQAVNFMAAVGAKQGVIQALEDDKTLSGPEKLAKASAVLLSAAQAAGIQAAKYEADFAAQTLLFTLRKIGADAVGAIAAEANGQVAAAMAGAASTK